MILVALAKVLNGTIVTSDLPPVRKKINFEGDVLVFSGSEEFL